MESTINPYEVKGKIDYERIISQFGVERISQELLGRLKGNVPKYIKRGFVYAHRDFDKFLLKLENGEKSAVLTGRGPSENLHLGHIIPLVFLKYFQDEYDCFVYIPISDDEKFYAKKHLTSEQVIKYAKENLLDILAIGFNINKTRVIMDFKSMRLLYPHVAKVAKKITLNTIKGLMGFDDSTNIGLYFYPAIQAVHILFPEIYEGIKNILVPIGIDQDPYMRLVRDIAEDLGYHKPCSIYTKYIPPLTGIEGKMSASDPMGCIYLTDDEETIKKKIRTAVTGGYKSLEDQKKYGGKPERCTVYQYLLVMFAEDDEIQQIDEECKSGKRMCISCKKLLTERIIEFLKEHKEKREEYRDKLEDVIIQ